MEGSALYYKEWDRSGQSKCSVESAIAIQINCCDQFGRRFSMPYRPQSAPRTAGHYAGHPQVLSKIPPCSSTALRAHREQEKPQTARVHNLLMVNIVHACDATCKLSMGKRAERALFPSSKPFLPPKNRAARPRR